MHEVSLIEMRRDYNEQGPEYFRQMRDQHGDVLRLSIPIIGSTYYLFNPEDIHEALIKQAKSFDKSRFVQRMLANSFGNGLFLSTGETWKQQRKLIQPSFHHVHIQKYAERMVIHAQNLTQKWQDKQIVMLDEEMHALAFTIVMDVLFSADASDSIDQIATAMHDLGQGLEAQSNNIVLSLMPDWMPVPILKQKRRGQKLLNQMVKRSIVERRANCAENAPHDLLSLLVFSRDEDTGNYMSDQQIHDELVTMYIAGHETTALLMGWVWVLLSQNPDVESKLHQELDTVLGGSPPTLEKISDMPYLTCVIKEALRLYPPAWYFIRETMSDVQLPNVTIKKGSHCFFISYVTHRDQRWFPEPDQFMPERWQDNFEKSLPKGVYIPFGLGARVCIGNGLALLEAQLVLATLAQQFRVELIDTPETKKTDLTLGFLNPVRGHIHKR